MKIFQVITLSELGGAQTVVANLSNSLCKAHDITVIAGEGDGKLYEMLDNSIHTVNIPSLVRRISPINELRTIISLRRLYLKYRPDIIHLHSSKAGLLGRIAFPKSKTVYTVHGFDSIRIAFRKFLPLERILQNRCSGIIGVSKYDEFHLKEENINKNVCTVYNGIYPPKKLNTDPFNDIVGFEKKILCIARLSPQKNHQLFIEIARRLPQYAFIWIGNQHVPEASYPSNVFWKGNLPDAGAYTAFADLFILTSNYEGLPMVIIEALSSGIPVVASNVGGISELLDGNNGIAVDNNPDIMAEKIKDILSLPSEERKCMSESAKNSYNRLFTVSQMAEGYQNIYNKIFNRNNRQ